MRLSLPWWLCSLVCAPAVLAQEQRPTQGFMARYREDWRVLDQLEEREPLDAIRNLQVGDGSLTFGGSARFRWENFQDFGAGTRDDGYLLSQLRLHANYWVTDRLRLYAESISAFSTPRDLPGGRRVIDVNELDLQQGFAEYTFDLDEGDLSLRAGRQALSFGRQRLVSPLPWVNAFRSWDGVRAIWANDDWTVSPFFTFFVPTQRFAFDTADEGTRFFGVYAERALSDEVQLDLYALGLTRESAQTFNGTTGREDRHTLGFRVVRDGRFDAELEGAIQLGEVGSGDVSAYFFDAELGYTFKEAVTSPRVFLGGGVASGDSSPGGEVGTFNQLFPLGHAYLGLADQLGRQNSIEIRGGLQLRLAETTSLRVAGHGFWRQSDNDAVYNVAGGVLRPDLGTDARHVGGEVDVTLSHELPFGVVLEAGYSRFFAGTFFERTGTSNDVDFFYLQSTIVF